MIEPRELRVGNLIYDNQGKVVEIDSITKKGVNISFYGETLDLSVDINPIPLTEEWLIKLGFERDPWGFCLEDRLSLSFSVTINGDFLPCWKDKVLSSGFVVKAVHQLQNLFFALTGEDLELKPH